MSTGYLDASRVFNIKVVSDSESLGRILLWVRIPTPAVIGHLIDLFGLLFGSVVVLLFCSGVPNCSSDSITTDIYVAETCILSQVALTRLRCGLHASVLNDLILVLD
jgi:hypothetical protein